MIRCCVSLELVRAKPLIGDSGGFSKPHVIRIKTKPLNIVRADMTESLWSEVRGRDMLVPVANLTVELCH